MVALKAPARVLSAMSQTVNFQRFDIDGPVLIAPRRIADQRGFFSETFRADLLAANGIEATFVQDNHVHSGPRGVLRGLHFQLAPAVQGKLVRVTRGLILDVCVDLRDGSPTFGQHLAVELSAANWRQLWVPIGFAHGYVTLEADTEVLYKTTDYYAPQLERSLAWDDPALAIDWRLPRSEVTLSEKDRTQPRLADLGVVFPRRL
jgi:dTDP-4-dehydrorhamnose 3,5-epimerase